MRPAPYTIQRGGGGGRSGGLKGHGDRTGQEASRAAPILGAMAERGGREAMADPGTPGPCGVRGLGRPWRSGDSGGHGGSGDSGGHGGSGDSGGHGGVRGLGRAMAEQGAREAMAGQELGRPWRVRELGRPWRSRGSGGHGGAEELGRPWRDRLRDRGPSPHLGLFGWSPTTPPQKSSWGNRGSSGQ